MYKHRHILSAGGDTIPYIGIRKLTNGKVICMEFKNEKMEDTVKEVIQDFVRDMTEAIEEMQENIESYENEDEPYENAQWLESCEQDVGSGINEYPTKLKARIAAKAAIRAMMSEQIKLCEEEKDNVLTGNQSYFEALENMIRVLPDNLEESYEDALSLVDDEQAETIIRTAWQENDLIGRLRDDIEKLLEKDMPKIKEELLNEYWAKPMRECRQSEKIYFAMCDYDKDEDDGYSYNSDDAFGAIYEDAQEISVNFEDVLSDRMHEKYIEGVQRILSRLCNNMRVNNLGRSK